jgi:hypothetical protein
MALTGDRFSWRFSERGIQFRGGDLWDGTGHVPRVPVLDDSSSLVEGQKLLK